MDFGTHKGRITLLCSAHMQRSAPLLKTVRAPLRGRLPTRTQRRTARLCVRVGNRPPRAQQRKIRKEINNKLSGLRFRLYRSLLHDAVLLGSSGVRPTLQ